MFNLKKPAKKKPQGSAPQSKRTTEIRDRLHYSRRVYLVFLLASAGILGLLARLYYLQVFRHNYYRTRSDRNRVKLQIIPPLRGNIYDRNGVALSENKLSYDLVVNRSKNKGFEVLVGRVKHYVRFDVADLNRYKIDKKKKRYDENIVVRADLSPKEMSLLLVDLYQFPGFEIVPSYKRYYPYGNLTAHVVGYINNINKKDLTTIDSKKYTGTTKIGRTGIEKQYENQLHGQVGFRQAEVSRTGKIVRILEETKPVPGDDLHLSFDLSLQKILQEELEKELYDGAGVAIDPNSGGILAMFSNPSFDANLFVNGISHKDYDTLRRAPRKNLFNRALNGSYSPASTIKPVLALAALHNDVVTPTEQIRCNGSYQIPEYKNTRKFYCWKRSGHGDMTVSSSIVQSCDVYFYNVGKDLGIQRIHAYLSQFGLGQKTGVDLPNESSGILPSKAWKVKRYQRQWFIGDTINASIGQGYMTTTPMQMAYFMAILAARGQRHKPHFVTHFKNPVTTKVKLQHARMAPVKQNHPKAWAIVDKAMVDVINSRFGTARRIKIDLPFKIAGKTGTAQVVSLFKGQRVDKAGVEKAHRDNSVFVAYAPAKNPVIAFALILENAGGGSETAAPIAARILERYFKDQSE